MGLFRQLQRLYRPEKFQFEDFHTEIVAQVLQNSPALTLAWLKAIAATGLSKVDYIDVRTQTTLEPLIHHSTASRPDIAIILSLDAKRELILLNRNRIQFKPAASCNAIQSNCTRRGKKKGLRTLL